MNQHQIIVIDFVRRNPNCKASEIVDGTGLKKGHIYKMLKSEFFLRSATIGGSSKKGSGFYRTYTVNEESIDRFCSLLKHGPKVSRIKRDPITSALFLSSGAA